MLSEEFIMEKLKRYANSPQGKKKIKEMYGIDYGEDSKSAKKEMIKEAKIMREILYKHITTTFENDDEIRERMKSFKLEDIIIGTPKKVKDKWGIMLSFNEKALERESLYEDKYPDGVEDIVLLLTKGYHAKDYVYGWYYTGRGYGMDWARIQSLKDRDPEPFLQNAVNEFNEKNTSEAKAALVGEYK